MTCGLLGTFAGLDMVYSQDRAHYTAAGAWMQVWICLTRVQSRQGMTKIRSAKNGPMCGDLSVAALQARFVTPFYCIAPSNHDILGAMHCNLPRLDRFW